MFIRFYELYYSRKTVISRLRKSLTRTLGRDIVVYGRKLVQWGPLRAVVPNRENLVINVRKNGESMSITVTPCLSKPDKVRVTIPTALIKDQLRPVEGSEVNFDWRTESGLRVRGVDADGNGHIRFVFRNGMDDSYECVLRNIVRSAYDMADEFQYGSDDDVLGSSGDELGSLDRVSPKEPKSPEVEEIGFEPAPEVEEIGFEPAPQADGPEVIDVDRL